MWDTIWKHEGMLCRASANELEPHPEVAIVREMRDRVEADTAPVACTGNAGDVVVWHHRLPHTAGQNYHPGVIRQAVVSAAAVVAFSRPGAKKCCCAQIYDFKKTFSALSYDHPHFDASL